MSDYLIRPATTDDIPAIAEIHERGWHQAYGHFIAAETLAEKSAEKRHAFWRERIADAARTVLVATEGGAVMGFVYGGPVLEHDLTGGRIDDFDSELYILHCRQEAQGRGLGKRLTAELSRRFKDQGLRSLLLWAFAENQFRRFYDRLGGEIVAEGVDEGQADVAYGWRDIDALIAACEGRQA
ncbi:MAG TPA: GNAT family N-acetyltransferase [Terriglobia bacterium]|nr:GNAT family N-acetyltransferase [Terriglobia bacterium]